MAGLGLRDVCPAESPASAKCALRYTLRASLGLREVRLEALPASAMFALTGRNTVHASHGLLFSEEVNRFSRIPVHFPGENRHYSDSGSIPCLFFSGR